MERLTVKTENGYEINLDMIDKDIEDCRTKLGKYEDLEEQVGCPLAVRCSLCEGRIIYLKNGNLCYIAHLDKDTFVVMDNTSDCTLGCLYYKDYGKDWWLKEDKSE